MVRAQPEESPKNKTDTKTDKTKVSDGDMVEYKG